MNGHLNQFTLNGIAIITKVNVLLERYVRVSRVSVFGEKRRNSYLRKSPHIPQSMPKITSMHSLPYHLAQIAHLRQFQFNLALKPHQFLKTHSISINLD